MLRGVLYTPTFACLTGRPFVTLPPLAISTPQSGTVSARAQIGMNILNVLYAVYVLSACCSVCYFVNHKQVYANQDCLQDDVYKGKRTLSFIQNFSIFAVCMLAVGTGTDNLRLFLGGLVKDLPDGIFFAVGLANCDKDVSCGIALGDSSRPMFLEVITWFCYGSHEIFGALFSIPVIYLWYRAQKIRSGSGKGSSINDEGMLAVDSSSSQALLPPPPSSTLSDADSSIFMSNLKNAAVVFFTTNQPGGFSANLLSSYHLYLASLAHIFCHD